MPARSFGEAAILKAFGHGPKSLNAAEMYSNLASHSIKKLLLKDIPGTKGMHLPGLKTKKVRESLVDSVIHPEGLLINALTPDPARAASLPLQMKMKSKLTGVEDVRKRHKALIDEAVENRKARRARARVRLNKLKAERVARGKSARIKLPNINR